MRCLFTLLFPLILSLTLQGQSMERVKANIYQQLSTFPQEKVYLVTDKAAYVAGEQIWFRAFLTDAVAHLQDVPQSRYVYVDLIDPNGTLIKHHKIRPDDNGLFHNRMELDDDMAEGAYMIRAYTAYMHARPDYLFEKKVFIADPQSSLLSIEPTFTFIDNREVSVSFRFRNLKDSSFLSIETIKFKVGKPNLKNFLPDVRSHFVPIES